LIKYLAPKRNQLKSYIIAFKYNSHLKLACSNTATACKQNGNYWET